MYEAFYKLRGKPFRLTPDAGMVFPSKGHRRAMSYLLYGLEQGEGFVMITGAVGTGKTLLIQKLLESLSNRDIAIASMASANLDGEDILPAVASEFDLPFEDRSKEALLQDVKRHLIALCSRHTHALLVVDEAQTLTPAALEMLRILSNLELDGRALMQVFLVGQSELRQTMVDNHLEQLRQRIVASYRLQPMDEDESEAYINHRLHAVDWSDDPDIAEGVFAAVHDAARGIPRKINLIMDRLLLYGYLEDKHHLDEDALATVLEEMHDEMPDVPQTLEPTLDEAGPAPRSADVSSTRPRQANAMPASAPADAAWREAEAGEVSALELKFNQMLLRVMREELRLKQMLESGSTSADVNDDQLGESIDLLRAAWRRD